MKRSISVSSVPAEQLQPLPRVTAPDASGTTGKVAIGTVKHVDLFVITQAPK
jgi:hypothetical protein